MLTIPIFKILEWSYIHARAHPADISDNYIILELSEMILGYFNSHYLSHITF